MALVLKSAVSDFPSKNSFALARLENTIVRPKKERKKKKKISQCFEVVWRARRVFVAICVVLSAFHKAFDVQI